MKNNLCSADLLIWRGMEQNYFGLLENSAVVLYVVQGHACFFSVLVLACVLRGAEGIKIIH